MRPALEPYQVLGVSPDATAAEVTLAYKTLVQIFHPDRFSESPAHVREEAQHRMKALNEAYALARQGILITRLGPSARPATPDGSGEAAEAGVPWDVASRERAAQSARANAARREREQEAANGEAVPRPRPRGGPSVLTGLGLARYTGNITCPRCHSVQWLPDGWQARLNDTVFHCSLCDRLLLAR